MPRRGGRSSLGRASIWPKAGIAILWLTIWAAVVGGAIAVFSSFTAGMGTIAGAGLVQALVVAYDRRWQRLQSELFVRRRP